MNMMIRTVSCFSKYIIDEILIPRLEAGDSQYAKDSIVGYRALSSDEERRNLLSKNCISRIKEKLRYLKPEDLEDFVSNVISTTIQSESNDYHMFLKSRNGFWTTTFDVLSDHGYCDFEKTFSYFMFKAVQSETSKLKYRFKHEVFVIEDCDGEISLFDEREDERDDDKSLANFSGFEENISRMVQFAETTPDFDHLDRKIFKKWIELKDNGNFTDSVNMVKMVYNPIISDMRDGGGDITTSALHFRWNRIRLFLKDFILSK